nr:hypothetical protein [Delftia sp. PS-11]
MTYFLDKVSIHPITHYLNFSSQINRLNRRFDRAQRASDSQTPQSLGGFDNGNALMVADGQQVFAVTSDDQLGTGSQGGGDHMMVVGVSGNNAWHAGRHHQHDKRRAAEKLHRLGGSFHNRPTTTTLCRAPAATAVLNLASTGPAQTPLGTHLTHFLNDLPLDLGREFISRLVPPQCLQRMTGMTKASRRTRWPECHITLRDTPMPTPPCPWRAVLPTVAIPKMANARRTPWTPMSWS